MAYIDTAPSRRAEHNLVEGEFGFTADDFRNVAAMLHADAGIALSETKANLVYSRLAKRLRKLGIDSFKAYCGLVSSPEGTEERQKMLAALTTNVTRFFREEHHFAHLKAKVLPNLINRVRQGGRARIWSAGCSSGQEPYSIALTLLSLMPDAGKFDIKVLATDIDPNVIAEGRRGYYNTDICAPIGNDLLTRWFQGSGREGWTIGPELGQLVSFRELNLMGNWPMRGQFDVIFCRNVAIYFEEETQSRIWARFTAQLSPGGSLYIGHSERVSGAAADRLATDGLTTYRLKGAGA
jgi:chemotaxis protein methyltransferase CheR